MCSSRVHSLYHVSCLAGIPPGFFWHPEFIFSLSLPRYQVLCISTNSTVLSLFPVRTSSGISLPIGFWALCKSSKYLSPSVFVISIIICLSALTSLIPVLHFRFLSPCHTTQFFSTHSSGHSYPTQAFLYFHFQHQLSLVHLFNLFFNFPPSISSTSHLYFFVLAW